MNRQLHRTTVEPTVVILIINIIYYLFFYSITGQSLSNQCWILSLEGQGVCEGSQPLHHWPGSAVCLLL